MTGNKITIGYFADGPWPHRAFEHLIQDMSIKIAFICVRYGKRDPVLCELGKKYQIEVLEDPNVNSLEFIRKIGTYRADLFVSMSFNQIFRKDIINLPRLKTINCHAGKLPFYRGRNILNWALINDEKEFGITVHYVDEGIDTGDIILQRVYPITDEDNYKTLLERSYTGCADILYEAIKMVRSGVVYPIKQDTIDKVGMYCGIRQAGDEIINWHSTSREIFNFIRALCEPGPMAMSMLNGEPIQINCVKMVKGAKTYINIPGQIIGKAENSFYVKTGDSFIEVTDYRYDGRIRIGDRMK